MNVLRWIAVLVLLCLAFLALGIGKAFAWLGDVAEEAAEKLTLFAALVSP